MTKHKWCSDLGWAEIITFAVMMIRVRQHFQGPLSGSEVGFSEASNTDPSQAPLTTSKGQDGVRDHP